MRTQLFQKRRLRHFTRWVFALEWAYTTVVQLNDARWAQWRAYWIYVFVADIVRRGKFLMG